MERMNILAIGAHPDDIEYGCGGSLIKFIDKGHRVFLLIMTKGGLGGDCDIREQEQAASAGVMGVEKVYWGEYHDTRLAVDGDVIKTIEWIIGEVTPRFIFCHHPDDTHQDHRHLAQATITATRYIKNVLFYEGPTTQNFNPQVFVDIASTVDRKIDALHAHRSQVARTNIGDLTIAELSRATAHFRGIQGRVKWAEAFHIQRLFINV
jgi:LmbE family N-acetylglucosaminyl deacetylase